MGGLTVRTPDIERRVIDGLSMGTPLAVICREQGMPSATTIRNWRDVDGDFACAIARAREDGHDAIAERARMTARGKGAEDGGESSGDVQRDKLIIETDLKLLAKWDPKRYGEKFLHGSDPANPLPAGFNVLLVSGDDATPDS